MSREQLDSLRVILQDALSGPPPTLEELRSGAEQLYSQFAPPEEMIFKEVLAERRSGPPLKMLCGTLQGGKTGKILLYFHGGGYVAGSASAFRGLAGSLASLAGLDLVLVDYRLAPENPYPAANIDAIDAYEWLLAGGLGSEDIVVSGDSAGAALALHVLQESARRGHSRPTAAVLFSPWVDLGLSGTSIESKRNTDVFLQPEMLRALASQYCGSRDPSDAFISPLYATMDFLPPLLIQVGSEEILLDDAVRLASLCGAAGVSTRLEIWPGMPHVWQAFTPILDEGREALEVAALFARQAVARQTTACLVSYTGLQSD